MRKLAVLLLSVLLMLSLCSCKSKEAQSVDDLILAIGEVSLESEEAILEAKSAYDKLTEKDKKDIKYEAVLDEAVLKLEELEKLLTSDEEQLLEYILKIINNEEFDTPSNVRVLEIGDYKESSKYKGTEYEEKLYGPDTVVVRFQGVYDDFFEGKQDNPHFMICLSTDENTSEHAKLMLQQIEYACIFSNTASNNIRYMSYIGTMGEYKYCGHYYELIKGLVLGAELVEEPLLGEGEFLASGFLRQLTDVVVFIRQFNGGALGQEEFFHKLVVQAIVGSLGFGALLGFNDNQLKIRVLGNLGGQFIVFGAKSLAGLLEGGFGAGDGLLNKIDNKASSGGGGGLLHDISFPAFSALAVLVATLIFCLRGFVSLNLYAPIIANRVSRIIGYPMIVFNLFSFYFHRSCFWMMGR